VIKYPNIEDIIFTNKRVIEETKITKAERHGLLSNAKVLGNIIEDAKRTKGAIYGKAAVLLTGLVQKHPFESGNRRTAFIATNDFLEINKVKVKLNIDKIENILQGIRERYYNLDEISNWIKGGDIREFKRE